MCFLVFLELLFKGCDMYYAAADAASVARLNYRLLLAESDFTLQPLLNFLLRDCQLEDKKPLVRVD